MKTKTRWLDTALRAQQARTLQHHQRAHESRLAQQEAVAREAQALNMLHKLATDWRQSRDLALLTRQVDGMYQRFHAHLQGEAADALQARIARQQAHDADMAELRQSHAIQQALDRVVQRRDKQVAAAALAVERTVSSEGWMLHRASMKDSP